MGILDKLLGWKGGVRRPRIAVRVPIEERAEMQRVRDGSAQSVILEDLSHGGARIATPSRLAKGEELTLIINAGKRQSFAVGCTVVTLRRKSGRLHFEYGVQFTAVRPGDVQALRKFVADRGDARKTGQAFI